MFVSVDHAAFYEAILAAWQRDGDEDPAGVLAELRAAGVVENPVDLLAELNEHRATVPSLRPYSERLLDLHRRRGLIAQADRIVRDAADLSTPTSEAVDNLLAGVSATMDSGRRSTSSTRAQAMRQAVESIRAGEVDLGIDTGLQELDNIVGGMRRGHLLIAAARPSMGKSAFCLDVAVNVTRTGVAVALFSLEMSSIDIAERLLAKSMRLGSDRLRMIRPHDVVDLDALDTAVEGDDRAVQLPDVRRTPIYARSSHRRLSGQG